MEPVVVLHCHHVEGNWVVREEQQIADVFAQQNEADAQNGVEPFVALAESVTAQLNVVALIVVVQVVVIDFEAMECRVE